MIICRKCGGTTSCLSDPLGDKIICHHRLNPRYSNIRGRWKPWIINHTWMAINSVPKEPLVHINIVDQGMRHAAKMTKVEIITWLRNNIDKKTLLEFKRKFKLK